MKKKFTALFIISMFLLSMIPLAFAQDGEDDTISGEGEAVPTEEVSDDTTATPVVNTATPVVTAQQARPRQPVRHVVRQEVRQEAREHLAQPEVRQQVRQKVRSELRERLKKMPAPRVIAKAQLERTRNQYQKAKENFKQVRDIYIKQRQKFSQARENYKECKGVDSEDCNEKRAKLKQNAKPHLDHAAELVLKELERVKAKIEASEDLSDEEVADMLADLEELKSEVEDAKATIEALDDDAPSEEYNAAVKQIREAWKKTKPMLKKHVGRLAAARLGNIIHKTEILEKRLYNAKDKLEEQGKDTAELEGMLDDFSAKLDEAADKYQKARELWSDANTPGEVDDAAKEIHGLMKEAQESLKEAHDMLRDIIREIKAQNSGSLDVVKSGEDAEDESGESVVEEASETEVESEENESDAETEE